MGTNAWGWQSSCGLHDFYTVASATSANVTVWPQVIGSQPLQPVVGAPKPPADETDVAWLRREVEEITQLAA